MEARLQSSVLVAALRRLAEAEGGSAAVIAKGDPDAGAILVLLAERGVRVRFLERAMRGDGRYVWQDVGQQALGNIQDSEKFLEKRRRVDPDMWILELDIASAERFGAEMIDSV